MTDQQTPTLDAFDPRDCLTQLFSKAKRRKILVLDLESKDGPSQKPGFTRVFLAGFTTGKRFFSFRNEKHVAVFPWKRRALEDGGCIDQLMRAILSRPYRGYWIFAHFGGGFDHLHLLPWLRAHSEEFSFQLIPTQSTIQMLKVVENKSGHTWTFLDSMKLLPMGLERAAKAFGFKGKLDHDLASDEADRSWETYLEQDCLALFQALSELQKMTLETMGGELGITAPATAMKLYRRRFMGSGQCPDRIPQHRHFRECADDQCEGCLHAWMRQSYAGGRTEAIAKFGRNLSYFDINSSYPFAMTSPMPGGIVRQYGPSKGPADFARLAKSACGFVECEVFIPPSCYFPPLPVRHPLTRRLVFPTGHLRGIWSWEELALLDDELVGGRITQITRSIWYEHKMLFVDFVKELYAYRDKSSPIYNLGLDTLAKLLMNALYGKFAMGEDRHEIRLLAPGEALPENASFPTAPDGSDDIESRIVLVQTKVSPPYIIPQISAQITALGRARLWRLAASVLRVGGRLYYLDTDSLICDRDDLPTSGALGALKNEYPGETIDAEFLGPKAYILRKQKAFAGVHLKSCVCGKVCKDKHDASRRHAACEGCSRVKIALKGVPKQHLNEESFERYVRGGRIDFQRLEKVGGMLDNEGFKHPPRLVNVHKSHLNRHEKRVFFDDGSDSAPLYFDAGFMEEKKGNHEKREERVSKERSEAAG